MSKHFRTPTRVSLKRTLSIYLAVAALLVVIGTGVARAQVQLNILSGVQLTWATSTNANYTYRLQWSSDLGSTWTDLVAAAPGNGMTNTLFDPFPSGTRLYQLTEIIPAVAPSSTLPTNGGFEAGSGSSASNWVTDTVAGRPAYGGRTNHRPHN